MKERPEAKLDNYLESPLWYAAFRPLFSLSAFFAIFVMLLWPFVYYYGLHLPGQASRLTFVGWHAYNMLYGFIIAALAGFILTAIAEFTDTPFLSRKGAFYLVVLWVFARLAFFLPGTFGAWLVAIPDIAIVLWLVLFTLLRLNFLHWKKHYDFVLGLVLLLVTVVGYHVEAISGFPSLRWVRATTGVWMMLIVIALSRISMRIVNDALEEKHSDLRFVSRPPRKHLALITIFLFTAAEFAGAAQHVNGWLALAAMAAIFNLLNDWHLSKDAINKWSAILYTIYIALGSGYGFLGLTKLLHWPLGWESAARHILLISAVGVAVFMVFTIAGRNHSGHKLDERKWIPLGVALLTAAMLSRVAWSASPQQIFFWLAAAFWIAAFALSLYFMLPIFLKERPDGKKDASG